MVYDTVAQIIHNKIEKIDPIKSPPLQLSLIFIKNN